MIDHADISAEFASLLLKSGWTPDRRVEISAFIKSLSAEGFTPNEGAQKILETLCGLKIHLPKAGLSPSASRLNFDPVAAATDEFFRAAHFQSQLGITLFPLGEEETSGAIFWAGSDAKYYLGREFGLYLMGHSFREAADQLAFPQEFATLAAAE